MRTANAGCKFEIIPAHLPSPYSSQSTICSYCVFVVHECVCSKRQVRSSFPAKLSPAIARVDESSDIQPSTRLIYIINCLAPMHEALAAQACTAGKAREVAQIIEAHTVSLVDSECGQLLMKCSMSEVVERVRCAIERHECILIPLIANSHIRAPAGCTLALAFRHDIHLLSMWMVSDFSYFRALASSVQKQVASTSVSHHVCVTRKWCLQAVQPGQQVE